MKRISAIVLMLAMILTLGACGSSASGGSPSSGSTPTETNETTEASEIPTTQATEAPTTESTTEPATEPATAPTEAEELDLMSAIIDTWYAQDGQTITFYDDGTCEYKGGTYTWTAQEYEGEVEASTPTLDGTLWQGEQECYAIRITLDKTYGYPKILTRPATQGGYYSAVYFSKSYFDVIEITVDNWQDYFEIDRSFNPVVELDGDGNIHSISCPGYIVLKEAYTTEMDISTVTFSYSLDYTFYAYTYDPATGEVTIGAANDGIDTTNVDRNYDGIVLSASTAYDYQRYCRSIPCYANVIVQYYIGDELVNSLDEGYIPVLDSMDIYGAQGELWLIK